MLFNEADNLGFNEIKQQTSIGEWFFDGTLRKDAEYSLEL